ncbi:TolB family protein [Methanococcoides sp. AM1]|uniref:TolB family protein n=1 Tax=Methanococcoides sp. AM1 TaxID=1201011 RepID=UPI0010839499|nr:TolB family protein [Methanococcoides sp. AM1]
MTFKELSLGYEAMKTKLLLIFFLCFFTINIVDASEILQLTNDTESIGFPQWSPDGDKIIYTSSDLETITSGDWVVDFWMMDADGSNKTQLASGDTILGLGFNNPLSPDGTQFLFISNTTGNHELWIMNVNGSNKKQLTHGAHLENNLLGLTGRWGISWSPDSSQIVYVSASSENRNVWESVEINSKKEPIFNISKVSKDYDIWIVDHDGSNNLKLTTSGKDNIGATWRPDGGKIAFVSNESGNGGIWVMNKDGSDKTQLVDGSAYNIDWSPDGTKIVYAKVDHENYTSNIWVMDADGSNKKPLTNNSEYFVSQSYSDWSPDGSKIVFNSGSIGEYEIWIMNSDGTDQIRIGEGLMLQWSPKGDKIVSTAIKGDILAISVIVLDEELVSRPASTLASVPESPPEKTPGFSVVIAVLMLAMTFSLERKKRI